MKTLTIKIALLIMSLAVVLGAASCDSAASPAPAPEPQVTAPVIPPPIQPDPPPPQPQPPVQEPGWLEPDEYYYLFGDPNYLGIMFLEGGKTVKSSGEEASYEITDSIVIITSEGEWETELIIIDEYTIEEPSTGMIFIREGGAGFGGLTGIPTGPRVFFTGENYYIDGDEGGNSICFMEGGEATLHSPDETRSGTYTVAGNEMAVTVDGEVIMNLSILNPAAIENRETSEVFGLAGVSDKMLVLQENYYQFGNQDELSLNFLSDGEVIFVSMGEEIATGTYTLIKEEETEANEENGGDEIIIIDLGGEVIELRIVNYYVLYYTEQSINFVRLP